MLNLKIYFWHIYKTIKLKKKAVNLIEKVFMYILHNAKVIKTLMLKIQKTTG